jgi:hypothetical protein
MKTNIVTTALILLCAAQIAQCHDFEFDGHFSQEAVSENGKLLAISSTLSTTVYKVVNTKAELESIAKFTLHILDNDKKQIVGYPLTSVITNDGVFVGELNGQLLEAWKIDSEGKAAYQMWSIPTGRHHFTSLEVLDNKLVLAQHSQGILIYSLENGDVIQE